MHLIPCKLSLVLIVLLFSACSIFTNTEPETRQDSRPTLEDTPAANPPIANRTKISSKNIEQPMQSVVEILWKNEQNATEKYIINYGNSESFMDHNIELTTDQIDQYEDSAHGPVFRYFLKDLDPTQDLYFNIQAVKNDQLSEPSKITHVPAQ